jgi:serine/threonine protein kinase
MIVCAFCASFIENPRLTGTTFYCAPDLRKEGYLGPPADVWSLGIVLFNMVTGVLSRSSCAVSGLPYVMAAVQHLAKDNMRQYVMARW